MQDIVHILRGLPNITAGQDSVTFSGKFVIDNLIALPSN